MAGALALHLLAAALLWWWPETVRLPPLQVDDPAPGAALGELPAASPVALVDPPSDPARPIEGAEDRAATGAGHPLPAADVDSPGDRAAARGGGGTGGPPSSSEQHYRRDASEQPWSDPDTMRQARHRTGDRAASEEAILRDPARGLDDRTTPARPLPRAGELQGRHGRDGGQAGAADGAPAIAWDRMDPRYQGGSGPRVAQRTAGANDPRPAHAFAERGATSADALRDGRPGDRRDVPGASDETDPLPADLVSPRSGGGSGDGMPGRPRIGHALRGRGQGTAASRAEIATGAGAPIWARRDDPYFRRFHDRLDREIQFPRELKIRLEQGQLVARFVLRADGTLDRIEVTKSSGFAEFDRELVRALRSISPLGPVPRPMLHGADHLAVVLDYAFKNPVIR